MKRFWLANNNLQHRAASQLALFIHRMSSLKFSTTTTRIFIISLVLLTGITSTAQTMDAEKDAAYKKTVTERVIKIVNVLDMTDSNKYQSVLSIIVNQYFQVNTIHEENKTAIDAIKTQALAKEQTETAVKVQEEKKAARLLQQHEGFITLLKQQLTEVQLEKVKDGMTYRVFPITYTAYLDMVPGLTTEQKDKLYGWLKEARELAMDAESADKKHAVFGKYKGRINNYLSAAGYDMKKEGEEWQKRIKEREGKAKEKPGS